MNKVERINVPVTGKELRVIVRAAKVVGLTPTVFARDAIKMAARKILRDSGVVVKLDMSDFLDKAEG